MVKKYFLYLLIILVSFSCSIQSRKDQENLRVLIQQKEFDKALLLLESSELKKDSKNKLLYLMEKGVIKYSQHKYKESLDVFVEANTLVDKLYTKSVREKIASSVLNDNSETYYGSLFERSLLYYYQAMSAYSLFITKEYRQEIKLKDGKKKVDIVTLTKQDVSKYKDMTRSTLVAWDSFFQEMKRSKRATSILKFDLFSKFIAAKIHEGLGTRRDKETAFILYQDARKLLVEIGPTQSSFNLEYEKFNTEVKKYLLGEDDKKSLKSKSLTKKYESLVEELDYQILSLAKSIRKNQFKRLSRQLKPSQNVINRLKQKDDNVEVIIADNLISELKGKDFSANLRAAIDGIEDPSSRALVEGIGVPVLTYFALGPLGLGYASHHGNVTIYSQHRAGEYVTKEVGVEFELPYVEPRKVSEKQKEILVIKQKDKTIKEVPLALVTSLSDYAFISSQEKIENTFAKRSVRIGIKYALAIVAAYGTYKKLQETSGEIFAKPAAMTQFLISSKAIRETEKADTRHWGSLPSEVYSSSLKLPIGEYEAFIHISKDGKLIKNAKLGKLDIKPQEKAIFSYRSF